MKNYNEGACFVRRMVMLGSAVVSIISVFFEDHKGFGYSSETVRVLKEKEVRQQGEYRTRRLVLAAWDRMEANGEFTAMGM